MQEEWLKQICTEDPEIPSATVEHLVAFKAWRKVFMHPCPAVGCGPKKIGKLNK
jgi:hypothetical protein